MGSREREKKMKRETSLVRLENSMKFRIAGREDDNRKALLKALGGP